MKKAEAISILATSVRPREPKDRARYDEAVKMAIEALKCSETPKSSERTAEIAQDVKDGDLNWAIPSVLSNLVPAGVVADIVQDQRRLEESIHRIKQLTGISIDDLLDLFAQGYELKAPSAQPEPSEITDEKAILHLQSTGWMQNHDREMYESGLKEQLADDSGSYDSLIPYENAISRQAAVELAMKYCPDDDGAVQCDGDIRGLLDELENLPSEQSEPHWIPCSERLPEEDHWLGGSGRQFSDEVLVSVVNYDDEDTWVYISQTIDGKWALELPRHCEIAAWMPLPKPYRGGEKDDR